MRRRSRPRDQAVEISRHGETVTLAKRPELRVTEMLVRTHRGELLSAPGLDLKVSFKHGDTTLRNWIGVDGITRFGDLTPGTWLLSIKRITDKHHGGGVWLVRDHPVEAHGFDERLSVKLPPPPQAEPEDD